MASDAGQKAIADSVAEYPLRPGVTSPFDVKPFDTLEPPHVTPADLGDAADALALRREAGLARSEEHTSELQSLMRISYAVFGLKKTKDKHVRLYKTLT